MDLTKLRTGIGTDFHAFSAERSETEPLQLAGLSWEGMPSLVGHSDGDAVAHAIADAVLGAADLGDLGAVIGAAGKEWAGASGIRILTHIAQLLREREVRILSVSAQLIAAKPKFSPRRQEAQEVLSQVLTAPVTVTATTTDSMGFIGREEGVAVVATALVLLG